MAGRQAGPSAPRASLAGIAGALVVCALILLGSRGLSTFDAALVGYAVATILLAFGVTYRYALWVQHPPTRRLFVGGWRAFLSWRNLRRFPLLVPRMVTSYLGFQTFLRARDPRRWIAHQLLFWGVILAVLITFPLTFGWFSFTADTATGPTYAVRLAGWSVFHFDSLSVFGWLMFHGLDIAAVLVLAGAGYFLWRRFRDRAVTTGQRFGADVIPLLALVAVSATGLLLTFSSTLLDGAGFEFLAVTHMVTVVFTLVYVPFGKFFHIVQRPASVGMTVLKRTSEATGGAATCRRCGAPIDTAAYVDTLRESMDELELDFADWVHTCPRCKRVARGAAYLANVKAGFR